MGFLAISPASNLSENTLTAVLPVMTDSRAWKRALATLRLSGAFIAPISTGTLLLFAWAVLHLPIFNEAADAAFLEISRGVMHKRPGRRYSPKGVRFQLDDYHLRDGGGGERSGSSRWSPT